MTPEQITEKETQLDSKFNKWKHYEYSDEELKEIAMDIYNNKIFTNRHLADYEKHMTTSIFMPMLFMVTNSSTSADSRSGKIDNVLIDAARDEYFAKLGKTEEEVHAAYIKDIGLIFEYYSKALPTAINGCPTFGSVRYLTIEQTDKMNAYYIKIADHMKILEL
jgi:hypothetical protein